MNPFTDASAGDRLRAQIARNPSGDVARIHELWTDYAQSKGGRFDCRPSEHWIAAEQSPFTLQLSLALPEGLQVLRCYDHAGAFVDPRMHGEVLNIAPVKGLANSEYEITIRFRFAGDPPAGPWPKTVIVTAFAVRENDTWKLAGALNRLTRNWQRETVGPITYIISPGLRFSRARAEQAVAFADSLSSAFNLPRLRPISYYLVRDGDAMMRVQGYHGDMIFGTPGGRSLGDAIISGDSVFRENHGHEIVHSMILPLQGRNMGVIGSEGVPTWLGGTRTMRYPEALRALREHLVTNPAATLDSLIESNLHQMHNPAAALLAAMSFERAGVDGIRHFLNSGPSTEEFRKRLEELFAKPWPEIAADWKRRALSGA
jgi:hypothetical protein